jgi:predicted transcriptional regulator
MLVQAKKILALECGGYRRYFENTGKYSPLERKILASLTDVNKRRILQMMIQSPVTQSDMRDQLHLSVPSIVWHIHRLCDEQLVIKNDSLRPAQYLLKDEVSQFLRTTVFFTSQE